jgi:hypothetical protein
MAAFMALLTRAVIRVCPSNPWQPREIGFAQRVSSLLMHEIRSAAIDQAATDDMISLLLKAIPDRRYRHGGS